jgi:secreted trypsin-like serine protease
MQQPKAKIHLLLGAFLVAKALVACGPNESVKIKSPSQDLDPSILKPYSCDSEDSGEEGPGIVSGVRLKKQSRLANSIVFVRQIQNLEKESEDNIICTGTLIAPNTVLTAAHCVFSDVKEKLAERTKVYFNVDPFCSISKNRTEDLGQAVDVQIHPTYDGTNATIAYDLALIKLRDSAPQNYRPMTVAQTFVALGSDQTIYLAGFGVTTDFEVEDKTAPLLRYTKAKPFNDENYRIKNSESSPRLVMDQSGGGACRGDSGGPAIVREGGHLKVIGVASQVTSSNEGATDCHSRVIHTSLSFYNEWLSKTFAEMNPGLKNPFKVALKKKEN